MKHLVLIVGVYYPEPSPTGKCAKQYISLLKDEYKIDVIFIESSLKKHYGVEIDNETLYGLSNWRLWIENWFLEQSRKSTNKFLLKIFKSSIMLIKTIGRLQSMLLFPNNLRWFYKKAFKTVCRIHEYNPIHVIFTINSPFSAHLAGEAFKKKYPDVRWVTYTVDPFHIGYKNGKKKESDWVHTKALSVEKRIIAHADANFLSEEVFENSKSLYVNVLEKTYPLPYLLPFNENQCHSRFDSNKINLVYAGRFYKDIRNPEYLLRTFLLTNNENMVLHLYATSDCEAMIDKYIRESSGRIIRHAYVDSTEIQKILCSADVLVTVGNSIPQFRPSKTFEYLVTGRPIINIYQNGLIDEVIDKYPLALQINSNTENSHAALEIEFFCVGNKGKRIEQTTIDKIYQEHSKTSIQNTLLSGVDPDGTDS